MKLPSPTLVTPEAVERTLQVTDTFSIDRDAVVIPLKAEGAGITPGLVHVLPDGKLLLHPPPADAFEPWLAALPERLAAADLRNTRRAS